MAMNDFFSLCSDLLSCPVVYGNNRPSSVFVRPRKPPAHVRGLNFLSETGERGCQSDGVVVKSNLLNFNDHRRLFVLSHGIGE